MTDAPHYTDGRITVHAGDCLDVLRTLPDASVDSVVTDPPYGLSQEPDIAEVLRHWLAGDDYVHRGRGFMGKSWDSFVPGPAYWRECFRVLKPGGHLLCFAGTRTADIMGIAIRLAGFERRDTIRVETTGAVLPAELAWEYGSGFPKSLAVDKAIDRQREDNADWQRIGSWLRDRRLERGMSAKAVCAAIGAHGKVNHGGAVANWEGGLACPTWEQWVAMREALRFGDEMDAEVWRLSSRKGTPGEAWGRREVIGTKKVIPGVAFTTTGPAELMVTSPATEDARRWDGWGTALKPAYEPVIVARKPLASTVAGNVLTYGTGGLNIDACRVPGALGGNPNRFAKTDGGSFAGFSERAPVVRTEGRWPSNVVLVHAPTCGEACVDGCPVAEMDTQSGERPAGSPVKGSEPSVSGGKGIYSEIGRVAFTGHADSGGASRFFPTFRYEAKADSAERPRAGDVTHPTVKPLDLMRWLVRLVTPPGGTVLDPFAGSGTTAEACLMEGFRCITVEREPDYLPLIVHRITKRTDPVAHLTARADRGEDVDLGLFGLLAP